MNVSEQASKLANTNQLSRVTLSVTRDTKRNQLIITQKVSSGFEKDYREEITYHLFEDVETTKINDILEQVKANATMSFLGLGGQEEPRKAPAEPKKVVQQEETAKVVVEEKPSRKRRTKKEIERDRLAQEAAAKKEAPKETYVAPDYEEDDPLGEDLEPKKEEVKIPYAKGSPEHAAHLREMIEERFGKDWKKDPDVKKIIQDLVSAINGKVSVVNGEGELLPTFVKFVTRYFEAKTK